MRTRVLTAIAVLVLCGVTGGCAQAKSQAAAHYQPVHVETIDPASGLKRITFTAEGASKADIQTAPVVQSGAMLAVPSAALIYDNKGNTLVYVALDPLTYQRETVDVVIDDGRTVKLSRGPKVGTQVVTTGANQVWGAELGVGH
ncbi:MAG: hypothetical protein WCF12_01715 [Propionicimonas sp.]